MSTCISTKLLSVDKACGKPVDNVDNSGENRDIPPLFPVEIVDNPVDTVDESALWLCIDRKCEDEYAYLVTNPPRKKTNISGDKAVCCMQRFCIHAGNPAGMVNRQPE